MQMSVINKCFRTVLAAVRQERVVSVAPAALLPTAPSAAQKSIGQRIVEQTRRKRPMCSPFSSPLRH